ncbi:MAG: sugar phosphate isomerase/epimerase [Bryobacterales bacterium]|nr:sugar phosphate isomerase/epimerase [Bryobacterales bacterium]
MFSRRAFGRYIAASLPALPAMAKIDSKIDGVMIGAQSYSFRDRPLDAAIQAYVDCKLGYCELYQGHTEPRDLKGEALVKWRETVPLSHFREIRGKFDRAGIELYAYNYPFRKDFTDREIERGFEFGRALGVKCLTASANVSVARRIDPFARKYKMPVGMHNHSRKIPDEFARPEDFAEAMKGMSKYICVNLDVGHFWAAGYDPVSYLKEHHDRIVTLHLKDRDREGQGKPGVLPFGEGTTPVREVMQLLKKNRWPIPAMIEYEYKGGDTVAEVKKSYAYLKQALA